MKSATDDQNAVLDRAAGAPINAAAQNDSDASIKTRDAQDSDADNPSVVAAPAADEAKAAAIVRMFSEEVINEAHISATDMPHQVVEKLRESISKLKDAP